MLKPSFGFLKKVFNPVNAVKGVHKAVKSVGGGVGKAVKGVASGVHKQVGRLPGPRPPGFGARHKKADGIASGKSRLAPRESHSSGSSDSSSNGFGSHQAGNRMASKMRSKGRDY